jgi:hypothetical protein
MLARDGDAYVIIACQNDLFGALSINKTKKAYHFACKTKKAEADVDSCFCKTKVKNSVELFII